MFTASYKTVLPSIDNFSTINQLFNFVSLRKQAARILLLMLFYITELELLTIFVFFDHF